MVMPCRAASPLRGTTRPAKPSGSAIDTPVADRRTLSRGQLDGLRRAQVGPGIARVSVFGDRLAGDEHFNGFCHESRVVQNG